MFLVAVTGGIASGKSTVSRMFADLGCPVIDADVIARQGVYRYVILNQSKKSIYRSVFISVWYLVLHTHRLSNSGFGHSGTPPPFSSPLTFLSGPFPGGPTP